MLINLLNSKFDNKATPTMEWLCYFKYSILVIISINSHSNLYSQKQIELNIGSNLTKIYLSADNYNIKNKSKSTPILSPVLGLTYHKNSTSIGFEFKSFKVKYSNEFNCVDSLKNSFFETTYKGRFIQFGLFTKQQILKIKKSSFNIISTINLTYSNTPFDDVFTLNNPGLYKLVSSSKTNLGLFWNLSLGLEYNYKINNKIGIFLSSNINSNFNRTLLEENNTVEYPDKTFSYHLLKVNGKSIGANFGFTYNLTKISKS